MILIDALYINNSGGKKLLEYLIKNITILNKNEDYIFIIDRRLETKLLDNFEFVYIVKPNLRSRYSVYKKIFHKFIITKVFCFNNLPPPFKIDTCSVYIYFHNLLLIDQNNINANYFDKMYYYIKRLYLFLFNNNKYKWVVQTQEVLNLLHEKIKVKVDNIFVIPFFVLEKTNILPLNKKVKFLYVADGSKHKNHDFLFQVFQELASKHNAYPELLLTIDQKKFPQISTRINELNQNGIQIANLGFLKSEELINLYNEVEYCIYPSKCESFGLPLIEAAHYGCKIIAIELNYVKQVIIPSYSFNGNNTNSLVELLNNILNKEIILPDSKVIVENQINKLIKLIKNV